MVGLGVSHGRAGGRGGAGHAKMLSPRASGQGGQAAGFLK